MSATTFEGVEGQFWAHAWDEVIKRNQPSIRGADKLALE